MYCIILFIDSIQFFNNFVSHTALYFYYTQPVESTSLIGALDSSDAELIFKKEEDNDDSSGSDTDTDDGIVHTMPI